MKGEHHTCKFQSRAARHTDKALSNERVKWMGFRFLSSLPLRIQPKLRHRKCPSQKPLASQIKRLLYRASLVAQWLRVCLPMQGTRVRALLWEDPTCRGATRPVSHNYWACASGACAPQQERPRRWEARAPRWRVAPTRHSWRRPSHRNEDPTQP